MTDIYYERLAVNMPEYMDASAKRLALTEAYDKVERLPEPFRAEKLAELGEIALLEDLDWWLKKLSGEVE